MRTPTRPSPTLVLAVALVCLLAPAEGFAQRRKQQGPALPRPNLLSVFPLGVPAGGSADVTLRGTNLEGVTTLWFDHPGLRAFHLKGLTFRVVAATGTVVGHHDVRAVGTFGVSNPRAFVVGDRPESVEKEPNNTPEQAGAVDVNSVVHGEIGSAVDVDAFAFAGKKGQRVLADLEAERVDSRLDATLRLLDPSGREIAESRDAFGLDPFLDVTLPTDGRYVLKVHDVTYRGSNEYPYRLTLTDGPHLDAIVPVVAKACGASTFTLIGRNLGGEAVPDLSFDGRPLEKKTVTVTSPEEGESDTAHPPVGPVPSAAATRRGFEYTLDSPSGRSNPVFVAIGDDPVVAETEPNGGGDQAQKVTPPCDVSGCFNAPGDLDVYRFRAKKGDVWWLEVDAERIGSPADPVFTVQKVNEKGATSDLATGEDLPDRGGLARFNTGSVDAALRWTVPEDGLYQVAVSDLFGSQRGDVRLAYRLNIRPERPDFRLIILPSSPDQLDSLTLNAGGRTLAFVLAARADGFDGPIRVEATELPPSVRCDPVVIPAGQTLAPLVFEAAEDARPFLGTAKLVGRARRDDGSAAGTREFSHEALSGSMVWPPQANANNNNQQAQTANARLTRGFAVKVIGPAALLLTASPAERIATPGSMLALDLKVKRREGFSEAVAVTLVNPPPGLANPPTATIAKGTDSGTFALTMPRSLSPGTYTLVVQGAGPFPFSKDPASKSKSNVNLSEPSNPVSVRVRPSPASVGLESKGPLKAGGSLEVSVTVKPTDKGRTKDGPIAVSLAAPASFKLSAEAVKAEPGKPAKLVIKAAVDSPVGAAVGVAVRASVVDGDETVEINEPLALTIAK